MSFAVSLTIALLIFICLADTMAPPVRRKKRKRA
jgi:hypothetical protein